jgi:hypothetical protein
MVHEEVYLFGVIRNPRWLPYPFFDSTVGDIFDFFSSANVCEISRNYSLEVLK